MNQLWARLGGPDAISWVTLAVSYPVLTIATLVGSGGDVTTHWPQMLWVATLGQAGLMAVLLLGRATLLRSAARRPVPVRTLAVFALALLARAVVVDHQLQALDVVETSQLLYRYVASWSTGGVSLVLVAYTTSLAREVSGQIAALSRTNAEIAAAATSAAERIARRRGELVERVRAMLADRLGASLGDAPEQVLARLRETIETVVRPISMALVRQVDAFAADDPEPATAARIDPGLVVRAATLGDPIRPLAQAVIPAAATLAFVPLMRAPGQAVLVPVAIYVVTVGVLELGRVWWSAHASAWRPLARGLALTAILAVAVAFATLLIAPLAGQPVDPLRLLLPLVLLWTLVGWVVALADSLHRERQRVVAELEAARTRLHEALVRTTTAYRFQQQAIARALHGRVQDALSAATFRLAAAIEQGEATQELVADLHETISATLALFDDPLDERVSLPEVLDEIAELWDGVTAVRWQVTPAARAVLADRPIATETTTEIVREACANAIRHGTARDVEVTIALAEERLRVEVTNDAAGVPAPQPPRHAGMGTLLFDELTLAWTLDTHDDRTRFTAVLPVL